MKKSFIAILLSVTMLFSLLPISTFAEDGALLSTKDQIVNEGGINYYNASGNSVNSSDDWAVSVSKTIEALKNENEFEITLEVVTSEEITTDKAPADALVVLVLDVSGSMTRNEKYRIENADRSRMWVAADAAKRFIESYANIGPYTSSEVTRGLSIVAFGSDVKPLLGWTNVARNAATGINALNVIDTANTPVADIGAGTNMAGGLRYANNLLGAVPGAWQNIANVHVILVSDGGPTCATTPAGSDYNTASGIMKYNFGPTSVRGENQAATFDANDNYKDCVNYAVNEANALKSRATLKPVVHSIGFTTQNYTPGQQEYWAYRRSQNDMMSVTEVLKKISSNGYIYDASDNVSLDLAFKTIYGAINVEPWVVTDPMGGCIIIDENISGDRVSFDNNTLKWDLTECLPVFINNITDNKTLYTYRYSYKISLDTFDKDFSPDEIYDTNGETKLSYVIKTNGVQGEALTAVFRVPSVKGYVADLVFPKIGANNTPLPGADFILYHNGLVYRTDKSDGIGNVKFTVLPSGHSYTLKETAAPEGYVTDNSIYTVVVSYGGVKIFNQAGSDITSVIMKGFSNVKKGGKGAVSLDKTVGGVGITAWIAGYNKANGTNYNIGDLIQCFNLYGVTGDGVSIDGLTPVSTDGFEFAKTGRINFGGLEDGWYAIEEVLTDAGKKVFDPAPLMYVLIENGVTFGGAAVTDFDYGAFYTIINGYGKGYVLGYPGLNNTGDIFPIGVKNYSTGRVYPSFCAEAGSKAFAGESGLGCSGYMVANKFGDYAKFAAAYNYIEEKYGKLENYRAVTQIVTWCLLGAIDIRSKNFDNIRWINVTNGSVGVSGIKNAKEIVKDVIANYSSYGNQGDIIDVVYLTCEKGHDTHSCQPQLVPVYGKKGGFDNKIRIQKNGVVTVSADVFEKNNNIKEQDIYSRDIQEIYKRDIQKIYERCVQDTYKRDVQDVYERDVQNFYCRDIQNIYEREVQDIYSCDTQDFYVRDVQNIYSRDVCDIKQYHVQDVYIPVFERKVSTINDTLVTLLEPGNGGGKFGNHMTYLKVNVTDASSPNSINFTIADSSPSNKPIGYGYNVRIEGNELVFSLDKNLVSASVTVKLYSEAPDKHDPSHHVTITNGQELRIPLPAINTAGNSGGNGSGGSAGGSTGGLVATTSISGNNLNQGTLTIIVKDAAGNILASETYSKPGNSSKDFKVGGYTVNVQFQGQSVKSATVTGAPPVVITPPAEPGVTGGSFYMFVHFDHLCWYPNSGGYVFKGWELKENIKSGPYTDKTETGEYKLIKTVTGEYKLVKTEKGKCNFVKTVKGEYKLIDTKIGDYKLVQTVTGKYKLIGTKKGEYKLFNTEKGAYKLVSTVTGNYKLADTKIGEYKKVDTIKTSEPAIRPYTGNDLVLTVDGVEKPLDKAFELEVGEHTFVISFNGNTVTEKWVVTEGENKFVFKEQYVEGKDNITKLADVYKDNVLPKQYADNKLEDLYRDNVLAAKYVDIKLAAAYSDNKLADKYSDNKLADKKIDKKLDDQYIINKLADKFSDNKLADIKTDNKLADKFLPDKKLPDKKLGSEDPENPDSILYGKYTPKR